MKMPRVCKNCNDRYPACWGSCEKYRAARSDYDAAMNEFKRKEAGRKDAQDFLFRSIAKTKRNR